MLQVLVILLAIGVTVEACYIDTNFGLIVGCVSTIITAVALTIDMIKNKKPDEHYDDLIIQTL